MSLATMNILHLTVSEIWSKQILIDAYIGFLQNFVVENARSQQFQDTLEKKDREIAMLKESHEKLKVILAGVNLFFFVCHMDCRESVSFLVCLNHKHVQKEV